MYFLATLTTSRRFASAVQGGRLYVRLDLVGFLVHDVADEVEQLFRELTVQNVPELRVRHYGYEVHLAVEAPVPAKCVDEVFGLAQLPQETYDAAPCARFSAFRLGHVRFDLS